ncbi:MAG: glycosyltransferase family 4 protein [Hyphomicrobiaceae bacterium]
MKLIFLNRFFYPDHSATSQMLSDLVFALAERGRTVIVITSRQRYDAPEDTLVPQETVNGVSILRVRTSRFGRGNLVGRAIDYATFYLSAAWCLWRLARSGDVVIAKTDPPMLSVIAVPVCWLRGARLVNWLQDVFPEVATAAGVGGRGGNLVFSPLRRLRNRSLAAAEANVVLGRRMAEHLRSQGVREHQIRVIPNWQDGRLVRPVTHEANPLREAWGLNGKFVVGYSGNLGRVHELDTIMDALALVQSWQCAGGEKGAARPEIVCLFIGGGALHATLAEEVARRQLESIEVKPYQPRDQLSQSLSIADVHLVTLRPEFEGLIVPSKFYGVAAAGRATLFIGDPDGEIPRLLSQYACGLSVEPGDGEGLARAILALSHNPKRYQAMGRRARTLLEERFDRGIALEAWVELFDALQRQPAHGDRWIPRTASGAEM